MRTNVNLTMLPRIARRLALVAVPLVVATVLTAPAPAWAGDDPTPAPAPAIEPDHTITCDYWAGYPWFKSGDTMHGWAYWDCTDNLDIHTFCARTQVYDKVDKTWIFNNFSGPCTGSTATFGNINPQGFCVGAPGNWNFTYRIYFWAEGFHGTWARIRGWGPTKVLSC